MLIKGIDDPQQYGRKIYGIKGENIRVKHFVVRTITPENPFKPHSHEKEELWYILSGNAIVTDDGIEFEVEPGDLLHFKQQVEHGLRTNSNASFICLG